jgi:hypothetical protein
LGSEVPDPDLLQTAAAIASNRPRSGARQVLVDVDALDDTGAGTQRALLRRLIAEPPAGWRIEPVRHDGKHYRYARRFTLDLIGRADLLIEDAVAHAAPGDMLLTLGAGAAPCPPKWAARGVLTRQVNAAALLEGQALAHWLSTLNLA